MSINVEIGTVRVWHDDEDGEWCAAMPVYIHGVVEIPREFCEACADAVRPLQVLPGYDHGVYSLSLRTTCDTEIEANSKQTADKFEESAKKMQHILKTPLHVPR
jgi:hypothetical protein